MADRKKTAKADPAGLRRTLVTPEGVDLGVELAPLSARFAALVIDGAILFAALLVMNILASLSARGPARAEAATVIWMLVAFLLRNAWFIAWEMSPAGATPGKRIMKIRVAMRGGGRLTADAVFARNVTREMELFLPLTALLSTSFLVVSGGLGGFLALALVIWTLALGLLPLFNRDKLRAGDLIAGTWVVQAPRHALAPDLTHAAERTRFVFTPGQLDAYGVMELQVLEDVLRAKERAVMADVARRIRGKIGWDGADGLDVDFLTAYYTALRERLEKRMLFGHRRADKHDRRGLA